LAAKVESYQKQLVELQQVYVDYQRELAEKEGELTKSNHRAMEKILRRIGTERRLRADRRAQRVGRDLRPDQSRSDRRGDPEVQTQARAWKRAR